MAMNEDSILAKAHDVVYGDREIDYGHPVDNHWRTMLLWNAYLQAKYRNLPLNLVELDRDDICYLNLLQKVARDIHSMENNIAYEKRYDTWVDIAGWAENLYRVNEFLERADSE